MAPWRTSITPPESVFVPTKLNSHLYFGPVNAPLFIPKSRPPHFVEKGHSKASLREAREAGSELQTQPGHGSVMIGDADSGACDWRLAAAKAYLDGKGGNLLANKMGV